MCVSARRKDGHRMKREIRGKDRERLAQEIAGLTGLSVKELKDRWGTLYGAEPHQRLSREPLTSAIAYRSQELAFVGLKPPTRRLLNPLPQPPLHPQSIPPTPVRKTPKVTILI